MSKSYTRNGDGPIVARYICDGCGDCEVGSVNVDGSYSSPVGWWERVEICWIWHACSLSCIPIVDDKADNAQDNIERKVS